MKQFFASFLLTLCTIVLFAQQQMPPIPIDPNVRIGHLDNGLTYYIRHNEEPKGQANFYIAQKVGSILEDEEQRGLAHFLEHMCFNGTKNFPGNGVIKYCESIGVKFGADLNAYTAMDETVYNIDNVPVATTPSAIDSCLWILHDWADGLLLTDEDIDHERGVIHEEWRSRSNATMRMYEKILPLIYPNNRYGTRMPIGLMEVVDFFPYKVLRDYYEKWYRPDQQGIIVVGDINVDEVETKIQSIFGTIAKPENPAERFYVTVDDNKEPIVAIAKDKEQAYALTYIFCKHDAVANKDKEDMSYWIYDYAKKVINIMLNQRLDELTEQPNPPFIQAGAQNGNFFMAKTKSAFTGIAVTQEKELARGMTTLYREMLRASRNGFTESEYDRARAEILTQLESAYNERNKVKSAVYCKQYVRHFIDNEPISGAENQYRIAQQFAPNIPVSVINNFMKEWIANDNIVITCMLPDKKDVIYPTEAEIVKLLADVAAENIAPYEDKVSDEPLISKLPKAGKVVSQEISAFGYKKLTLSNGAIVYLKSTDFKADQIQMNAFSEGGLSLYKESEAINLKVVDEVFEIGGLGNYSVSALSKALSGKKVSVYASVNQYTESLRGSTTPKDFETMLQLMYLYFTAPRTDKDAFQAWQTKSKAVLANAANDPRKVFNDTLRKEIYPALPRLQKMVEKEVDKVDYARVMQIGKERFANASDFCFTFTGNIDETTMIPLIEKYIASLPAKGKKEHIGNVNVAPKAGIRHNEFKREMETPTATVLLGWNGSVDYNLKNILTYSIADQILRIIMTEEIREKEGGTYGVSVSAPVNAYPTPNVMLQVYYQTDPDKYEYLNDRIEQIIKEFSQKGPSAENMEKVKEYMVKKYHENLKENNYFSSALESYLKFGVDKITDYEKVLNSITANEVSQVITNLLQQGNHVKVIMCGVTK